ncbi:MAG: GFA family protein [Pararhodobacter sp.]
MTEIPCSCGQTALSLTGSPILTATCHCTSCRTSAAHFTTLPGAEPVTDQNGGTPFVLWRKDRASVLRGGENLREHRLRKDGTRRVVAACCNAPMYLEFKGGHWLSVYASRFAPPPPPEMRTMLMDAAPETVPDDGLPGAKRQSARFMVKLLAAWAATGFRSFRMDPLPPLEKPS